MKTLFVSDLQLEGGQALGYGEYGEGSRFHDQVGMLDQIVGIAASEQVSLVVVLGDVFEFRRPQPWAIIAFRDFIAKLVQLNTQVLVLAGNHDRKSTALPSALSIFDEVASGVHVSLTPSLYPFGDVVVATLPWVPIASLVASQPEADRDDLNAVAAEALVYSARVLAERCRAEHPGAKAVLAGHWAVSGGSLPTGLPVDMLREPVISREGLAECGFDLAAFGHVHMAEVLSSAPPIMSAGSPYVCDMGESANEHGVWIFDTAGALRFVPVTDREFVTLDLNADELLKASPVWITDAWEGVPGAVVRARITCTEAQARRLDQGALRAGLIAAGAHKVKIEQTVVRSARARVAEMTDELSTEAAFLLWLEAQSGLTPETRSDLIALNTDYIARVAG